MYWSQAWKAMKEGSRVRLPHWKGFWCFNIKKGKIEIHCADGNVIDLVDTKDEDFTFSNIASDKWLIVKDDWLFPKEVHFDFQAAMKMAFTGEPVTNTDLFDKDTFICYEVFSKEFIVYKRTSKTECIVKEIYRPVADDILSNKWTFFLK